MISMYRCKLLKMHRSASTKSSLQFILLLYFLGGVLIRGSSAKDYWEAGLKKHNDYRAAHNTPLLELDSGLSEIADKCAQYYADKNAIDHSCSDVRGVYGENLYYSFSSGTNDNAVEAVKKATKDWYDEIKDYDFNKHGAKGNGIVGHFTQVVWKGSKKLGIGFAQKGSQNYVVGVYNPPGNLLGANKENVLPPSAGGVLGSDSSNSSASIPSSLIRGPKGVGGVTCLALFMSAAQNKI